ncbi:Xaa-Pro aminopeptidase, partial [Enteropsectra breve]
MRSDMLIKLFSQVGIDSYITFLTDNHLNEFINDTENQVRFLTGFTGTAGTAITTKSGNGLLVDGRYYLQAEEELIDYKVLKQDNTGIVEYLSQMGAKKVGVDPHFISYNDYKKLKDNLAQRGIKLTKTDNLVKLIMPNYKKRPHSVLFDLENLHYEIKNDDVKIVSKPNEKKWDVFARLSRKRFVKTKDIPKAKNSADKKQRQFLDTSNISEGSSIIKRFLSHIKLTSGESGLVQTNTQEENEMSSHFLSPQQIIGMTVDLDGKNITGSLRSDKISMARSFLGEKEALIITELDTIAWLFNLRGTDITNNFVFYSYAYISKKETILFVDSKIKLKDVTVKPYEDFEKYIKKIKASKVYVSGRCNALIDSTLKNIEFTDHIRNKQAIKTDAEIYGSFMANLHDAAALMELFEWLSNREKVSEKEIQQKLISIKLKNNNFLTTSFNSIVAFGKNGASMHHTATDDILYKTSSNTGLNGSINENNKSNSNPQKKETNDPASNNETNSSQNGGFENMMLLIDSGSQYIFGTTDITRTINLKPNKEDQQYYTMVLKAVIAGIVVQKEALTGKDIDTAARNVIKENGHEYNSATGHGLGSALFVHEAPPHIGNSEKVLETNMVYTVEPGVYLESKFGIRIEETVFLETVKKMKKSVLLSSMPLHMKLIDTSLLNDQEKSWL